MYTETYLAKVETYRSAGGHNGKMEIGEEHRGDITIVEIRGRIDINAAISLGERLTALIKAGRNRVLVDLKDLAYINSAGLRALLIAGRLAVESKGALVLCSLSNEVHRLFDLGAFTDLFQIYSSREEGFAKLS
jgi:anti-sigma B factor antagonist